MALNSVASNSVDDRPKLLAETLPPQFPTYVFLPRLLPSVLFTSSLHASVFLFLSDVCTKRAPPAT